MRCIPGGGVPGAGAVLVVVLEREKQPEQTVVPAKTNPRAKNFIMQVPQVKGPARHAGDHIFQPPSRKVACWTPPPRKVAIRSGIIQICVAELARSCRRSPGPHLLACLSAAARPPPAFGVPNRPTAGLNGHSMVAFQMLPLRLGLPLGGEQRMIVTSKLSIEIVRYLNRRTQGAPHQWTTLGEIADHVYGPEDIVFGQAVD